MPGITAMPLLNFITVTTQRELDTRMTSLKEMMNPIPGHVSETGITM